VERRRLGRGGKLGASEAVIAVEFAVELEQPIHRLQIALPHHRMRNDPRLADAGDLPIAVNTPPPKGGGFGLRLKAGSVGLKADCYWF
jgi:hypothetical protein